MDNAWFVWALIGVVCIGLELLLPGFVIFFFGVGALGTALLSLVPFVSDQVWIQVVAFIAFSVSTLVFFRRRFRRFFSGTVFDERRDAAKDEAIGDWATVVETAGVTVDGRIRHKGTTWKARTRTASEGRYPGEDTRARGMTYIVEAADQTGSSAQS
jgi:membrane protein implicated in regulation of membrane protease activity